MKAYETSATVGGQGEVRVGGVPFAPGTEVEVTVRPLVRSDDVPTGGDDQALAAARARMQELFRTIKGFRMSPRFSREELYDRRVLR